MKKTMVICLLVGLILIAGTSNADEIHTLLENKNQVTAMYQRRGKYISFTAWRTRTAHPKRRYPDALCAINIGIFNRGNHAQDFILFDFSDMCCWVRYSCQYRSFEGDFAGVSAFKRTLPIYYPTLTFNRPDDTINRDAEVSRARWPISWLYQHQSLRPSITSE